MSAPARFRLIRRFLAPRWLTEGEGELVGYSLDMMKDAFVERLQLGLLARFPETAPPDALAAIGRDRRVIRGINESAASYAQRLIRWLDDRKTVGNPFALMQKLAEYVGGTSSFRTVDARGNWYSRAADGTRSLLLNQANWNWDDKPNTADGRPRWGRFWVIIYPGDVWNDGGEQWGSAAAWGTADRSWGSSATPDQVATLKAIVADWKPAGTKCVNIILAFDPASFDPTAAVDDTGMPAGLWERWSKIVAGVQVPARLSTARYIDGVI